MVLLTDSEVPHKCSSGRDSDSGQRAEDRDVQAISRLELGGEFACGGGQSNVTRPESEEGVLQCHVCRKEAMHW